MTRTQRAFTFAVSVVLVAPFALVIVPTSVKPLVALVVETAIVTLGAGPVSGGFASPAVKPSIVATPANSKTKTNGGLAVAGSSSDGLTA